MRYGIGDGGRAGCQPLADMLTATAEGSSPPFHLDEKATEKPGPWCRRLSFGKRAWRMAASADGRVLVCGYFGGHRSPKCEVLPAWSRQDNACGDGAQHGSLESKTNPPRPSAAPAGTHRRVPP
jgi:hypothetical protein